MMPLLQELLGHPFHVFCCESLSCDAAGVFVEDALLDHGQITDTYVLGLAPHHHATLVSFHTRLSFRAVWGEEEALQLPDPG